MVINTDINILGGLSEFNLIEVLLKKDQKETVENNNLIQTYTNIKTIKALKRYEVAINHTLLTFKNPNTEVLIRKVIDTEGITPDSLLLLFWNAAVNNELLDCLNKNVYFPALYSGRVTIKKEEAIACLQELKKTEGTLENWSDSTIETTASKYLTLLVKFNLMEGRKKKFILHRNMNDKTMILFIYWLLAVEAKANVLESKWLPYCLMEREIFIQIVLQKKFMKYYNVNYSGDKLKIEPVFSYEEVYDELA